MYSSSKVGSTTNTIPISGTRDPSLLRLRYYNPNLGTFTSFDDFEASSSDPISLHKYNYGNGNPVSNTDPTGMFSLTQITVVTGLGIALTGFTLFGVGKATNNPTLASIGQSVGFFGLTLATLGPVGIFFKGGAGLAVAVTLSSLKLTWDIATKSLGGSVRAAAQQTIIAGAMSQFLSEYSSAYPRTKIPINGQIVARGIPSEDRMARLTPQGAFSTTPVPWVKDDFVFDFLLTDPGSGELVVTVRRATGPTSTEDIGQYPLRIGALSGLPYERSSQGGQTTKKALLAQ